MSLLNRKPDTVRAIRLYDFVYYISVSDSINSRLTGWELAIYLE